MVREFEDKLARGDMPGGADLQPTRRWSGRSASRCHLCSATRRSVGSFPATWSETFGDSRPRRGAQAAPPEGQAQGRRRHSQSGRDQGHCGGRQGPMAADSSHGNLLGPAGLRASGPALGRRRSGQAGASRPAARRSLQRDRQAQVRVRREDGPVDADRRQHAAGVEARLPEQ